MAGASPVRVGRPARVEAAHSKRLSDLTLVLPCLEQKHVVVGDRGVTDGRGGRLSDRARAQSLPGATVFCLGSFRVLAPDGTDITPSSALRQAILAVLVLAPGQSRPRRLLQEMFWGASEAGRAAASLRSSLYLLRQDLAALGPDILLTDRLSVRLRPASLEAAPVAARGGTLLEALDLDLAGCEGFEDWLRQMRATSEDPPDPADAPRLPAAPRRNDRPGPATPQAAIAVPRLALFCPRLADGSSARGHMSARVMGELASGLAAWRSFAVLAPYSSFAVEEDFGLPRDNHLLRADYGLSGQFGPGAEGAVLELRMVHLDSRTLLWSGRFPLDPATLQTSLARFASRIVATLAHRLERHERELLRRRTEPSVLLNYLEGRALQLGSELPKLRRARAAFQQAIAADPGFAPAHARVAETLYNEWILRGGTDEALLQAARDRAARAIDLDPTEPTGHWVAGAVALYQRRFDAVAGAFAEAEDLAPHDADLLVEYADALNHLGDAEAAERRFAQALDLNPLPPDNLWWVGATIAFHRGAFDVAAARCDRLRDAEIAVGLRTATYALAGRRRDAGLWSRRLDELFPGMPAEALIAISPYRDPERFHRNYAEGLRMAASG